MRHSSPKLSNMTVNIDLWFLFLRQSKSAVANQWVACGLLVVWDVRKDGDSWLSVVQSIKRMKQSYLFPYFRTFKKL